MALSLLTALAKRSVHSSMSGYSCVERIKAGLGQAKIQAITPLQIEHFYATLIESGGRRGQGLSGKTVRNTHVVLRKALADAERLDIVARNAASAAKPPTAERPENPTWSSEQLREFLDYLKDDRLRGAFVVLATTGMRRGEVLGLRWRDIDFDSAEMAVRNSITTAGPGKVVAGPPKTPRSRRQIYLDDATLRELREQRRKQNEERLAVGELWEAGEGYVFTDEIGRPVHPDKFSELFRKRMAEAGLPKIRLHDLRHSYATLALKAGVHPKVVSERLGRNRGHNPRHLLTRRPIDRTRSSRRSRLTNPGLSALRSRSSSWFLLLDVS